MLNKYKCKVCKKTEIHKKTFHYGSGMCMSCSRKGKNNGMFGKNRTGENNGNYKDGRTNKIYKCKICGKKISNTSGIYNKGRCQSCAGKGKKFSKQHRENMSKVQKGKNNSRWGKEVSKTTRDKISKANKKHWQDPEIRKKQSLARGGTGIPGENYDLKDCLRSLLEYREWRTKVYQRDNFTCQECGIKSGNGKAVHLEAHHKKLFVKILKEFIDKYSNIKNNRILLHLAINYKPFWKISNGQTLCKDCHKLKGHLSYVDCKTDRI
jgi:hypothetical protein